MAATRKPQIRFNREMRKAMLLGDSFDAYTTFIQFYKAEENLAEKRIEKLSKIIDKFVENGGTYLIDPDQNAFQITLGDVHYSLIFNNNGEIKSYYVENPNADPDLILMLHQVFYAISMMDLLENTLNEIRRKKADLENHVLINSLGQVANTIAGDIYLTAGAIAGLDLRTEKDVDPLDLFGDDDD